MSAPVKLIVVKQMLLRKTLIASVNDVLTYVNTQSGITYKRIPRNPNSAPFTKTITFKSIDEVNTDIKNGLLRILK